MRLGRGIGAIRGDFLRLFDGASAAGLGDGELLARFASRRDEAAFEALVARLGPMVLGACRRMLADPHDVEDAFQATFLVLVRKAGSIRERDLVATWLYEVAVRVARRARLDAARRSGRERRAAVAEAREEPDPCLERSEVRARIDEEIGRLPESHRRLVVLCDVEGLSREEAAARLGWTANMVRGRLERARGRLRDRLTRRGLSPSGAWLALAMPSAAPKPALVAATVRGALSFAIGRSSVAGLASSASAVALSEGVVRMMMLAKWKLAASALISAGAMVAGSGMLAARQGPGDGPPSAKAAAPVAPPDAGAVLDVDLHGFKYPAPASLLTAADPFRPRSAAELGKARVEAAKARYDTQAAFYREGRIAIHRVVDASRGLMDAERDAAGSKAARVAAAHAHHARLGEMLKKEQAELEVGRATQADVDEIKSGLLEAEFALAREIEAAEVPAAKAAEAPAANPTIDLPAKRKAREKAASPAQKSVKSADFQDMASVRVVLARRLLDSGMQLFASGEGTVESAVAASRTAMEAERDAADSAQGREAAAAAHVVRLSKMVEDLEAMAARGERTRSDVERARLAFLEAAVLRAREAEVPGAPGLSDAREKGAGLPGLPPSPDSGIVPSPAGTLPTTRPAADQEAGLLPHSLAGAVAEFNARASSPPLSWAEPPLTEDEVIAAIRYWQPNREMGVFLGGRRSIATPFGAPIEAYKAIAVTRQLPPGARFEVATSRDLGDDQLYAGWWVSLVVPVPPGTESAPAAARPPHPFPIRERLVRVVPLEEVLEQEKAGRRVHAGLILDKRLPPPERIKNLEGRIEFRDRRRSR